MRRGARLTRPRDPFSAPWRDRWTTAPVLDRPTTFVREPEAPLTRRERAKTYPYVRGWSKDMAWPVCRCGLRAAGSLIVVLAARREELRHVCRPCGDRAMRDAEGLVAVIERRN